MFLGIDEKEGSNIAALSPNGEKLSYKTLVEIVNDFKNVIGTRNLIFVLCYNKVAAIAGYVGLVGSKNVPLLLSADIDEELLQHLIDIYKPNYIWCPKKKSYSVFECCNKEIYSFLDYVLIKVNSEVVKLYEDLALLLTTSGSTGSPKLVRQSYVNILSNAESIAKYLELDDSERPITMLPMNYTYGLSVINSHLLVGATILVTENSYAQKQFWDFFKSNKATSIVGVPYTYEILKKLRFFKMELPSLRYMTQAGGKLLPELHKEFAEYALNNDKRFYVMYGQTEATARMSYLPYEYSLEKYGSMGIAIPGGEFSLIDENDNIITNNGKIGELVYKGPNVTLGYAKCSADLEKGDERHGVLVTGDMARRDEDGYYYIVGRKKRFLKIYGNRVNLDECEQLILDMFDDIECACVGDDDNLKIYVTKHGIEEEIIGYISEKTGLNKKAFSVIVISELPKNDSGKIQYNELR